MRLLWLSLISLGLLFCSCSESSPVKKHVGKVEATTRIAHTAGGGTTASEGFRARISIGVPQPYGHAEGSGKILKLGVKPSP
jgi:hypothetical protein